MALRATALTALIWGMASAASAATITVDHITCNSLVDAIGAANGDTTVNGCGPGSGADTIELVQNEVLSTVDNTGANGPNGLPVIVSDVTIRSQSGFRNVARNNLGPPPAFRLFEVASNGRLRLEDMAIENGLALGADGGVGTAGTQGGTNQTGGTGGTGGAGAAGHGGGIYNAGTVELVRAAIIDCHAQGGDGGNGGKGGKGGNDNNDSAEAGGPGGSGGLGGTARGGGVFSTSVLRVTATMFDGNDATGGAGGRGGDGGDPGDLDINSTINAGAHAGAGGAGAPGGDGLGGDVFSTASATTTILRSSSREGIATGGAGGAGGDGPTGGVGSATDTPNGAANNGGNGGAGGAGGAGGRGRGGAIFSEEPTLLVTESAFRADATQGGLGGAGGVAGDGGFSQGVNTGGDGGNGGDGGQGGDGGEGAGSAVAGVGRLDRCEVAEGVATGGNGGSGGGGGDNGGEASGFPGSDDGNTGAGGDGGVGGAGDSALAAIGGELEIENSTVSNNAVTGGNGGNGGGAGRSLELLNVAFGANGDGGVGGDGKSGAVWVAPAASAAIAHATIAENTVAAGTGGVAGTCASFCGGPRPPADDGATIAAAIRGAASLFSAIVSGNSGSTDQCAGAVTSLGFNLASDASCNLTGTGDQPSNSGADLAALTDNGGPAVPDGGATRTHALAGTSDAIDAGSCGSPPLPVDQRRFTRGGTCDAGAFEVGGVVFATLPTIRLEIDAPFQLEGNAGDTARELTLELSMASPDIVTVDLAAGGSATPDPAGDFSDPSQEVTFFPGVTSITTPFDVHGDTDVEATEDVSFTLSGATNATIDVGLAALTVINDDGPALTVAGAAVTEGDAGATQLVFTLQLSAPAPAGASVAYQTFDEDAADGLDYTGASGTLDIPENATSVDLPVDVLGDEDPEFDEIFRLVLGAPNRVTLSDGAPATQLEALGTIEDDDQTEISLVVTSTDPGSEFDEAECLPEGGADLAGAGGGDDLTLREAICIANNTRLPDVIVLADTTYTLTGADNRWYGPNGLPPIASEVTIEGNGARIERDAAAPEFRFFLVARQDLTDALTDGALTLRSLTLAGGLAKGGNSLRGGGGAGMGGGIFNQGEVVLEAVTLEGNVAAGGDAGVGGLGAGGGGLGEDSLGFDGGGFGAPGPIAGGYGGAAGGVSVCCAGGGGAGFGLAAGSSDGDGLAPVCNAADTKGGTGGGEGTTGARGGFESDVSFAGDAGDGGGGAGSPVQGGFGGDGGAFGFGGLTPGASGQSAGGGGIGGGGGSGRVRVSCSQPGGGGGFGGGGGSIEGACGADGGPGGFGGGGAAGGGSAPGGFGGGASATLAGGAAGGAGAGMGGAVFNHTGTLTCTNSTLSGNTARGGSTVDSGGGSGLGGAIFNLDGVITLTHCTLAANRIEAGDGGTSGTDGGIGGGAIYNRRQDPGLTGYGFTYPDAMITIAASILGDSVDGAATPVADCAFSARTGGDALAQITSGDFNVVETPGACVFAETNDVEDDPELGPLNDHGGPTATHRPASTSPAFDAMSTCSVAVDQNGTVRPQDSDKNGAPACEIGSVEVIPSRDFYTLTPCRVVDTRFGQSPALDANVSRDFQVTGICGVPADAAAVAINLTVADASSAGAIEVSAGPGSGVPVTPYSAFQTRASNAIVTLAPDGTIRALADQPAGTVHVILDVVGYFK